MSEEGKKPADGDKELDALLNSALADFVAGPPAPAAAPPAESRDESETSEQSVHMDSKWTEEFIKEAAAQFEQNIQTLIAQGQELGLPAEGLPGVDAGSIKRVAEAAARVMEETSEGHFSATISETLRHLTAGAENIQGSVTDEYIQSMLGNLSLGEGEGGADLIPFMQNMMQSLLSKEILYPALKDIVDKYPAWFEKNPELEESERERFTKQRDLMTQVCTEMDQESESDSPEVKNARFNKILELMQQLQEYGQPPDELVGDVAALAEEMGNNPLAGLPGLSGLPGLPGQPQPGNPNCNIM